MKVKISLLIVLFISFTPIFSQEKKAYKVNTIAFYNLENLFDTENDPLTYDDDRTPDGKDHWTEEIYQDKLKNMAKVMAEIGADVSGNTPTIIGVCETENRKVLEDLVNQETLVEQDYGIIQFDSPDRRGIDVALLYKKKLFTPISPEAISLPENIINPAIIKPVSVSIIGVALIITLPIFIFFATYVLKGLSEIGPIFDTRGFTIPLL